MGFEIIYSKKLQVNTASRMESTGVPEKIQITEATECLLKQYYPEFYTSLRGEIQVKVSEWNKKKYRIY